MKLLCTGNWLNKPTRTCPMLSIPSSREEVTWLRGTITRTWSKSKRRSTGNIEPLSAESSPRSGLIASISSKRCSSWKLMRNRIRVSLRRNPLNSLAVRTRLSRIERSTLKRPKSYSRTSTMANWMLTLERKWKEWTTSTMRIQPGPRRKTSKKETPSTEA